MFIGNICGKVVTLFQMPWLKGEFSIEIHPVERMLLVTVYMPFSASYSFKRIQMGFTVVSRFEYFTTLRETEL